MNLEIMATLWPEMPHYRKFAAHSLIDGIRLNTAMADAKTMPQLLEQALDWSGSTPVYFDVKGRQLRITKVDVCGGDHLELELNHPISVETPTPVLFKSGVDVALLVEVKDGNRLIFEGGPKFNLIPGESVNIRSNSLIVHGDLFTEQQLEFLDIAKKAGIRRYMLSYAGSRRELEELSERVGKVEELVAKIENQAGLNYVSSYSSSEGIRLLNARGDLFVEVPKPHDILNASRKIIKADPRAIVGSRILLSLSQDPVPSCADLSEIAWLLEIGYRRFMFCDSLCLDPEALELATRILFQTAHSYLEN